MNKSYKKIMGILGVSLTALSLTACSQQDKTVASYKGGKVTETQLYDKMKKSPQGKSTLQQILVLKALEHSYGDKVSDKDVHNELKKTKKKYGKQYQMVLQQNNMDEATLKDNLHTNLLMDAAVRKENKVTEAEEKAEWKEFKPKVEVRHILVKEEKDAKKIIKELDDGAKFADLVKKYSIDEGSKIKGGKIDAFDGTDTTLDNDFKNGAWELKQGKYSKKPVKSQFGYHIIMMDKRAPKGKFKDHKKTIDNRLYQKKLQDQTVMQKIVAKAIKDADITIKDSDLKDTLSQFAEASADIKNK